MIATEEKCQKCGIWYTRNFEWNDPTPERMVCQECHEKYYSKEALRDKKIEKLLKNKWTLLRK